MRKPRMTSLPMSEPWRKSNGLARRLPRNLPIAYAHLADFPADDLPRFPTQRPGCHPAAFSSSVSSSLEESA